jgi:lantibiotic biosynthesis protein
VLRTPGLAADELTRWSDGLHGASVETIAELRSRLAALIARPEVDEALFVASPALHGRLHVWRDQPDSEEGRGLESALVRYVVRMTTRATPFGMFAGVGTGTIADATDLRVPAHADQRRRSRLDNELLFELADAIARDPARRAALRFRPNSSLSYVGDRLRYAEARKGAVGRRYHLVSVERDPYLDATLERAAGGALLADLAAALVEADPEISREDADEFVGEAANSQVLVPELGIAVTGQEPLEAFLDQLASAQLPDIAERLRRIQDTLARLDSAGLAASSAYAEVRAALDGLPVKPDSSRLVQIDLIRPPCGTTLGRAVVTEVLRGVDALCRLTPRRDYALAEWVKSFTERYEEQFVPLAEALDEESGIGNGRLSGAAVGGATPLLDGLDLPGGGPAGAAPSGPAFEARHGYLLRKLVAQGFTARELVLDEADLKRLESATPSVLPDAWATTIHVESSDPEAIARGQFLVRVNGAYGPSGARMLGRFCHASPEINELVRAHLRAEEALRPDALFAEIVHLGEGRTGNILCRPVLRDHEIVYLGQSGAPPDRQISLADLEVGVRAGRAVLRSRSTGRVIAPRMSSAHNAERGLAPYRFLASLQDPTGVGWSWGPLANLRFLPRVRLGKAILARAQWMIEKTELTAVVAALKTGDRARIFDAMQELRERRALPARVTIAESDLELVLDLDNALTTSVLAEQLVKQPSTMLLESGTEPDQLCASGPGGKYTHEVLLTCVRKPDDAKPSASPDRAAASRPTFTEGPARSLTAATGCLYLKLYCGRAVADRVLREVIAPIVTAAVRDGAISHWFFIRYADPHHHLRVRCFGAPEVLTGTVQLALERAAHELRAVGAIWRMQVDTYEREIERYGGPAAIELVERVFWIDSEAVVEGLAELDGEDQGELRWLFVLRGIDELLTMFGCDLDQRLQLVTAARDAFEIEFGLGTPFRKKLGERFRAKQAIIKQFLTTPDATGPVATLARRAQRLVPIAAELGARDAAGKLAPSLLAILPSLVHMFVNRTQRTAQRQQELVLYELLRRHYAANKARASAVPA